MENSKSIEKICTFVLSNLVEYTVKNMELSADTTAFLEYLDSFSKDNLRKRSDVGTIFECGASYDSGELVNKIIVNGTFVWNVFSKLRTMNSDQEGYQHLEQEFAKSINDIRTDLADLLTPVDDSTYQRFEEIYFGMTQGVIRNIVDLAHDLSVVKKVQNDQKYE